MKYKFIMASSIDQLRSSLIKKISSITDEDALFMLEQELSFFTQNSKKDIVDNLKPYQVSNVISLVNEPSDKDTVNENDYKKATAKWHLK